MTRTEILQTAKPILFSTEMVRAIQDGRKAATRRPIKVDTAFPKALKPVKNPVGLMTVGGIIRPQYQVGDYLYVRETWGISNFNYENSTAYIIYKASENEKEAGCQEIKLPQGKFDKLYESMAENSPDWRPCIRMPKEAARIFLRVTDVRVERLQDITDEQAIREGCNGVFCGSGANMGDGWEVTPVDEYIPLWNSTVKKSDLDKYGWDANPWVFVIEFERVEVN